MQVIPPFPMPEEPPIVPDHLSERVINLLPDTTKIALKVSLKGGWQAVATIHIDGDEDATEVYTMVKAAADYHCQNAGESGKYRAQIWVMAPGKTQPVRNTVTFKVLIDSGEQEDDDAVEVLERRAQSTAWLDLIDREHRFTEFVAGYSKFAFECVLKNCESQAEQNRPMAGVMTQAMGMFTEGMRMKADAVRELGDMRVEKKLAEANHDDGGKMWEAITPALQVAFMQFQQRMLGGKRIAPRALPAPAAPQAVVARTEHQPPAVPQPVAPQPAPPQSTAAAAPETPSPPATLHGLVCMVLEGMGTSRVVKLMRLLDDEQALHFEAVTGASDDDSAATAIVGLMHSLMANPSSMVGIQQVLHPEQVQALQQLGMLAQRHLEERAAQDTVTTHETAPSSSDDAASAGSDDEQ